MECVMSLLHRECACVSSKAVEFNSVNHLAKYTSNNAYVLACIFKNRTLFNMKFKHSFIFIRIKSVGFVAFILKCWKLFAECCCCINYWYRLHHFAVFKVISESFRHIVVTNNTRTHHTWWKFRAFLICPNHSCKRMFMRNFFCNYCFKNFHAAHNAKYAVIVSAVFNRVAMWTHNYSFCIRVWSRNCCIHICKVICFDCCAYGCHSFYKFISCHNCFVWKWISCYSAVACITESWKSFDFVAHSFRTALIHIRSTLSVCFIIVG